MWRSYESYEDHRKISPEDHPKIFEILSTIDAEDSNLSVQVSGLKTIGEALALASRRRGAWVEACTQREAQLFLDLGGIGTVIKSMGSHPTNASVQTQALRVINLVSDLPSVGEYGIWRSDMKKWMESGINPVLIAMNTHVFVPDVQINGVLALNGIGSFCGTFSGKDVVPAVLTAMGKCKDSQVQAAGGNALLQMCNVLPPLCNVLRGRIRQEGGVRVVLAAMREHRLQLQLQQKACELMYELMYRLHTDLEESFDLWKPVVEEVVAVVLVSMQKHPTDREMLRLGSCVIGHYWRHWTLNIAGDGSNVQKLRQDIITTLLTRSYMELHGIHCSDSLSLTTTIITTTPYYSNCPQRKQRIADEFVRVLLGVIEAQIQQVHLKCEKYHWERLERALKALDVLVCNSKMDVLVCSSEMDTQIMRVIRLVIMKSVGIEGSSACTAGKRLLQNVMSAKDTLGCVDPGDPVKMAP